MIDAGGIIIATGLAASAAYFFVRQFRVERPRPPAPGYDLTPWGEVIQFPGEFRPARGNGGGASEQNGRADTNSRTIKDRTHDGSCG